MAIVKHIKSRNANYSDAISYLLFEHSYTRELMALGRRDALARKDEIARFFGWASSAAPEHRQNIHRGNGDLAGNAAFATGDRGNAGHDFQLAVAHPSGNIGNRTAPTCGFVNGGDKTGHVAAQK